MLDSSHIKLELGRMFHQVVAKFPTYNLIIAWTGTDCGGRSALGLIHEPEVYDEA